MQLVDRNDAVLLEFVPSYGLDVFNSPIIRIRLRIRYLLPAHPLQGRLLDRRHHLLRVFQIAHSLPRQLQLQILDRMNRVFLGTGLERIALDR